MTQLVTPPLSYQALDLQPFGAPLPLITGTGQYTTAFYAKLSNGDLLLFSFLYVVPGFACMRIKQTGESCLYVSSNYQINFNSHQPAIENLSSVQQITATNFILNNGNGGVYYFVLPSYFAPGATYVVPEIAFTPPAPCGVGLLINNFTDNVSGLTAYEFAQAFSDASNIYASLYGPGNVLITGGFIGNFPNGTDGFNRTALSLPVPSYNYYGIVSGTYAATNGGIELSTWGYASPSLMALGFSQIRINNGATLACGGSGSTQSYVTTETAYQINIGNYPQFQTLGIYNNFAVQDSWHNGAIDSPNACLLGLTNAAVGFSQNQLILFDFQGAAYVAACWLSGLWIYVCLGNPSYPNPAMLKLYRAPVLNLNSTLSNGVPAPLYNYARGVPINADPKVFPRYSTPRIRF